jgi:MoaA/NifB/PqqE/SkfB family radical SAM enzyme/Flp pilus assembly protein TadD
MSIMESAGETVMMHAPDCVPADEVARYASIERMLARAEKDNAYSALQELVRDQSSLWQVYNDLGALAYERGDSLEAVRSLAKAVTLETGSNSARSNLAAVLAALQPISLTSMFGIVCDTLGGEYTSILRALLSDYSAGGGADAGEFRSRLIQACIDAGQYEKAIAIARQLLIDDRTNIGLRFQLACATRLSGDPEGAYFHMTAALRIQARAPYDTALLDRMAGEFDLIAQALPPALRVAPEAVRALCVTGAAKSSVEVARRRIENALVLKSQIPILQDALFTFSTAEDPHHPRFSLDQRFCTLPFQRFDIVNDFNVVPCCSAFLKLPIGNIERKPWEEVWNSPAAHKIRHSIHDGTFRYCNKMTCADIQMGNLPQHDEVTHPALRNTIEHDKVQVTGGPLTVNLSFDKTCNLTCPSCRTEKIAADTKTRAGYDIVTNREIFRLLRTAEEVVVTGSGDPFASKTFRRLLGQLNEADHPRLKVTLMTNGVLFTPDEWERLKNIHRMLKSIYISIDAATAKTYEVVRRGGDWARLMENLAFLGEATRSHGLAVPMTLSFVVQRANFREMPACVDMAKRFHARSVRFIQMTNWNTRTPEEFAQQCIWRDDHPEHAEFLAVMGDPRLQDPIVEAGSLAGWLHRDRDGVPDS